MYLSPDNFQYFAHSLKPNWVIFVWANQIGYGCKMWWSEVWFSCRVYSSFAAQLLLSARIPQKKILARDGLIMVVICHNCHLREIPAFSISFASWEPTSRQPLLRCPLQASLQCIKNWKSDYLAKDGQRYLLYRVRIGFEVLLQFEGLVKGNRV